MKKIKLITILLLSASLILSFAACSDSSEEETTNSTEVTETTSAQTTIETTQEQTTQSTNAADYIPSPKEAYELLKPFYAEHGYDFDSWTVYSNTDDLLVLYGTNNKQMVMIRNTILIIQIGEYDFLTVKYEESGKLDRYSSQHNEIEDITPYDLCDVFLSNCPEKYKLNGEYLQNTCDEIIDNGSANWKKSGLEYSLSKSDSSSASVFTLSTSDI